MSTADLKELIKPPFANYDVVVYFGCGLFSLPLIYHYILEPTGFRFPGFDFQIGVGIAEEAIRVLSLLFSVYVLGHIVAFSSSLFIEKSVDSFYGKISSAILISTWSQAKDRPSLVAAWKADRRKSAFRKGYRIQSFIRLLIQLPAIPMFWVVGQTGGFDYYRSRIPRSLVFSIRTKLVKMGYGPAGLRDPWFKILEHVVINKCPSATARMYNYLVISGTFRSLSFLFLMCIWFEIYYSLHEFTDGHSLITTLMSDNKGLYYHAITLFILYIVYGFCVASYMKFSRRYAEEALFAFVLSGD